MNREQIRAAMEAAAQRARATLADLSSGDEAKAREARAKHKEALDTFDSLKRQLDAMDALGNAGGDPEFGGLVRDASMGAYVRSILGGDGAALTGAARELNDELRAVPQHGGVVVPWEVLERAATGTGQINAAPNQRIIDRVFAPSLAGWFGAEMRQVPTGTTELAVVTGKGSVVEQLAEGAAPSADPSAATFDTVTLKPKRLTGEAEITVEAMAQVSGLQRAIARDTLNEVNDTVSGALLNGDGQNQNVHGFLSRIAEPGDPGARAAIADYTGLAVDSVDGIYAQAEGDVSVLFGIQTFQHAGSLFLTNTDDTNALAYLRAQGTGVRASAKVPNGGGTGQAAAKAKRQAVVVRRGSRADASFAAMWGAGPELVRDPYTKADEGTLRLVWHLLWDARVAVRPAEWRRLLVQHAA